MIDFPYVDLSTNGTAAVALVVPGAAPGVGRRPRWSLDRFRPLAHRLRPAGDLVREESRRFVAPVAALSAVSAAATAASPLLLSWPLLLVALTPRLPFLVLAAAEVPLLPFLAVATIRLALVDPWYFALGRRRGPAVVELLGRRARWAVRLATRAAWLLVLARPVGRHLVLAGAGPSRGWVIAVVDAAGTLAFLVTVHAGTATVIG
ncbi:MAG: hypothetical protein H0V33_04405 [Acidimicrobiia bacterium]|nr:hypothetical protein [Acidimicrobiia bacterium]